MKYMSRRVRETDHCWRQKLKNAWSAMPMNYRSQSAFVSLLIIRLIAFLFFLIVNKEGKRWTLYQGLVLCERPSLGRGVEASGPCKLLLEQQAGGGGRRDYERQQDLHLTPGTWPGHCPFVLGSWHSFCHVRRIWQSSCHLQKEGHK